ncbi:MAG TPA: NAD(P)-dependent oxidoreductase [Gemmatimonadales bacterium]|nr:NAD(P)-dependent oxidoreductase [Gemmatimonadales bacterium]
MKIGIAGTGRMGAAMTLRLMDVGHELTVWNRTPGKTNALAAAGAAIAESPAALASGAEVIITMLTDEKAIEAMYRGPQGLLAGAVRGKLFIEMSTVRPGVEIALADGVRQKGGALVDCPVGGTVGPARDGRLFGFVGGADADVARARPVLEQLCRRLEHVGPVGAGARMKLAINLPLMVYWQAFGEALALCAPLKLDPDRLISIFTETSGGPNVLKARGPAVAAGLRGQDSGPVTFDVDLICKDLRAMIAEGRALGIDLPVSQRSLECFEEAAEEGMGPRDGALLPARFAKRVRP